MKATVTRFPRLSCGRPTCTSNKCWSTLPAAVQQLPGASNPERELIAQDVVATNPVDSGLALPTRAAQLAVNGLPALGHGSGECRAQIKIAPHTFIVGTGEA